VLKPVIDRRFALDDVADALRCVDQAKSRGKVVVTMGTGRATFGTVGE